MVWQNWVIPVLLAASALMMTLERIGVRTILRLPFKGDVKRETRFLSQYGQLVCTIIVLILVWQMDGDRSRKGRIVPTVVAVFAASFLAMIAKRMIGRVRPGCERAGQFLGPEWRHDNNRESFPSSHSACAVALSAGLAWMYPPAAVTFWGLAIICAILRYLMDAHWPSDVLCGAALGYACAGASWWYFVVMHPYW
ncbi:MAG TPA: phosphatase PAP2 family protein [Tepidisphaeraceae bacterium]|nr:phosphatase PAP2 family protein [Tepidisphaeraceae bacterium]